MRIPRSTLLWPETGTIHLFWRCHNREFNLNDSNKDLYFECIAQGLKYFRREDNVRIHSFCAMGNHFHKSLSYKNGSESLSSFIQYSHGLFGSRLNRLQKRSGAVAEGRPKTPLIENDDHEIRVHFYIESNPIRAGFRTIENLATYKYSSFGFYAFGIKSIFTPMLTIPSWYLRLGKTMTERRLKYRKLFLQFLDSTYKLFKSTFLTQFIGDDSWVTICLSLVKTKRIQIQNEKDFRVRQKMRLDSD